MGRGGGGGLREVGPRYFCKAFLGQISQISFLQFQQGICRKSFRDVFILQ